MTLLTTLIKLFVTFFKIGLFSFGGGLAMLPLIQEEVVVKHAWLTDHDFINLLAVAQSTPGPIAINSATFIGNLTAGFLGALTATIALCLPCIIIMGIVSTMFLKFSKNRFVTRALSLIKPATIGFIAAAVFFVAQQTLFDKISYQIDWLGVSIFAGVLALSFWKKTNPIVMTIATGCIGLLAYAIQ